ncbi:uncharacterized protein Z518_00649 [Rhinocladiella mackenziei CBS 650.93]|uniref:Major facilitator superfamily (MFS) profile domain-containing protein n=1 Tax=Rhinocladiella mackenziei CBS 650.93 TaxID=1442369 RepID=A0A0D2IU30_9EURO|nr:uncharacterized protein Z518_00649 [Rhinocladiella mackenziei CBS 650.93]KIX09569.1 hypothetical protein Z518_00649 [Rhinocladiella mackenziei CBS 650.93]
MAEPIASPPEKQGVAHLEGIPANVDDVKTKVDGYGSYGLVKSTFDELSIPRTLWIFKRVLLVSLAVYTGYVCEGFELNAGGSVIANTGFIKQFGEKGGTGVSALDATWVSTWSALLNVGQIVTFTYISWFADRFGRKASFYVAWAWLVVGCIFLNTAKSPSVWALAKLSNGAGIGVLQVTCQVYIMEICPNRIRGGMVIFQAVWYIDSSPELHWRYHCLCHDAAAQSEVPGQLFSGYADPLGTNRTDDNLLGLRPRVALVPRRPWGQKEGFEGYEAIIWRCDLEEEYGIIERTIEHEREVLQGQPRYVDIFKGPNLKRTLTVMLLAISQQIAGLAIISTYSTCAKHLLQPPRCHTLVPIHRQAWSTRTTINTCQTLICVILFVVGGLFWTGATTGNATAGTALVRPPVPLAPGRAFAHSVFSEHVFADVYATPPMLLALSLKAGFVFGAFSVPICILMWLYLPESKSRSAAEIDELYERKIPAWRWSNTVTAAEEQMHVVVQVKGTIKQGQGQRHAQA